MSFGNKLWCDLRIQESHLDKRHKLIVRHSQINRCSLCCFQMCISFVQAFNSFVYNNKKTIQFCSIGWFIKSSKSRLKPLNSQIDSNDWGQIIVYKMCAFLSTIKLNSMAQHEANTNSSTMLIPFGKCAPLNGGSQTIVFTSAWVYSIHRQQYHRHTTRRCKKRTE